jgi:hypothetical protein
MATNESIKKDLFDQVNGNPAFNRIDEQELQYALYLIEDSGYKIVEDNDARPTVKARDLAKELYAMYRTPIVVAQLGTGEVYVRQFGV